MLYQALHVGQRRVLRQGKVDGIRSARTHLRRPFGAFSVRVAAFLES